MGDDGSADPEAVIEFAGFIYQIRGLVSRVFCHGAIASNVWHQIYLDIPGSILRFRRKCNSL